MIYSKKSWHYKLYVILIEYFTAEGIPNTLCLYWGNLLFHTIKSLLIFAILLMVGVSVLFVIGAMLATLVNLFLPIADQELLTIGYISICGMLSILIIAVSLWLNELTKTSNSPIMVAYRKYKSKVCKQIEFKDD